MVFFPRVLRCPSGVSEFMCWCGITWSRISRNSIPRANPTAAGMKLSLPIAADCSIAGISRLHTEAAVMTPAANPVRLLCTRKCGSLRRKNTQADPAVVPINGISMPYIICVNIVILLSVSYR